MIGNLIFNLPSNLKYLYRQFENKSKKRINKEWSIKFNKTCLNEKIWPIYSTCFICNKCRN